MTIEEKYLELRKKAVNRKLIDTCSPTCTLKTDQNLAYIVLFKRRTKTPSVLNISQHTSNMAFDTLST